MEASKTLQYPRQVQMTSLLTELTPIVMVDAMAVVSGAGSAA